MSILLLGYPSITYAQNYQAMLPVIHKSCLHFFIFPVQENVLEPGLSNPLAHDYLNSHTLYSFILSLLSSLFFFFNRPWLSSSEAETDNGRAR